MALREILADIQPVKITHAWLAVLLLLALILPYEIVQPWFYVGSAFVLTNVELIALAALALWLAQIVVTKQRPRWYMPLALTVLLVLLAIGLSALFAPSYQADAFKVMLRWFMGALVGWMTLNAVTRGLPSPRLV